MEELLIPLSIKLLDFAAIPEVFRGQYDEMYVDGDRRAVVIVNPTPEMVRKLIMMR